MGNFKIYLITNTAKQKDNVYIGQTKKTIEQRFKEHIKISLTINNSNSSTKNIYSLHKAMHKYGIDAFTITLIEDNIDEKDIDAKEQYYINLYDSYFHGYNETIGGQGIHGYSHTADTKQKLSDRSKQMWDYLKLNQEKLVERNKKISVSQKGKKKSKVHCKKLSIIASQRVGAKNTFYGKSHSDKTKHRIKEANSIPVIAYLDDMTIVNEFTSASEAMLWLNKQQITTNKNASLIIRCCKGKCKCAYGFVWKYKNKE